MLLDVDLRSGKGKSREEGMRKRRGMVDGMRDGGRRGREADMLLVVGALFETARSLAL